MRNVKLWTVMLGLGKVIIESVYFDEGSTALIVAVRLRKGKKRCGICGKRSPGYDNGEGLRRWRTLDVGKMKSYVETVALRVTCHDHGPTVIQFPFARHDAGHTYSFDDMIAWVATHTSKTATCQLFRIAWRTVGKVITRVVRDADAGTNRLAHLTRIGIDEISYTKGHNYLTVVIDHDRKRLVWVGVGRTKNTLRGFFDLLGEERSKEISLVSADGASWIDTVVKERCPNAKLCIDPFHVVKWCQEALDDVRKDLSNTARKEGQRSVAHDIKGARYALLKNPDTLTDRQKTKLSEIQKLYEPLYRGYLLKEELRHVFVLKGAEGIDHLTEWLDWSCRSRIPQFVELSRKIRRHKEGIEDALRYGLSNGLVESTNTKIRLLMRMAFGFRSTDALIAMIQLALGGLCPPLPHTLLSAS